ncbi:unnamed protein product [Medioppia subpectinata]|uniref:Phospholipase B-like n=1 Tax=Medioppia subpectinata TaxID=1979941 RepID=A0A7R9KHZ1_9ACAR|nr:unnamed protein product [Medioppia subpectinata]CAG2102497.1 unnamed protein product [Medioppia subpectinata]
MSGRLEGYITGGLIRMHYLNTIDGFCGQRKQFCDAFKTFHKTNTAFINTNIKSHSNDNYWHQMALIYDQIQGLEAGYEDWKTDNNVTQQSNETNVMNEIWWLNLMFETSELEAILTPNLTTIPHQDHCSAMVKILPDGSDLYVAHNSWFPYNIMLRVLKQYSFAFNSLTTGTLIPGHSVSMSSYPGFIFSGDDYYVLSSGLVVQETTNENFNKSLYASVRPDRVVLEFVRNVVANRLASGGRQWTDIFGRYNSGTYNNQFMIVDYKLFTKGTPVHSLPDNLLWVCEQMPGTMTAADVTKVLRDTTYWGSYNVPYFKNIYDMSGTADMAAKSTFFSHNETARALIFKRDHTNVTEFNSLYSLMRYNDFKHDPLSKCDHYQQKCHHGYSGLLTIAARCDLKSPTGNYSQYFGHAYFGAIDAKMTNKEIAARLEMLAVSGPTHRNHPPFRWSTSGAGAYVRHMGQPDVFDFKPIYTKWYPHKWIIADDITDG